jgi:hypothetical protein
VIRITIPQVIDIGGEFVRWEVATAIAGAVLGIDPFDQPNVEEAKENTRRLLETMDASDASDGSTLAPAAVGVAELRRHLTRLKPNGYVGLQAYIAPTPERDAAFAAMRTLLRNGTGRATTLGYGPRFLHSTGQLHKGGPATGWFLQLTAGHPADRPIPGWPYTFGQLIDAQALGDFQTLEAHDLAILRVHLGEDPDAGLAELHGLLTEALRGEGTTT